MQGTTNGLAAAADTQRTGDWLIGELRPGHLVELNIYGEKVSGRLSGVNDGVIAVHVPIAQQAQVMRRQSTVYGTAVISVDGGAASAPVSCWPVGDSVRMRVVGPVELIQRRLHKRVPVDMQVMISWTGDRADVTEQVLTRAADISLGGMRVQPANIVWPSLHTRVTLALDLPAGPVTVVAESLGKTPDYGLRLRFLEASTEAGAAITKLVDGSGAR